MAFAVYLTWASKYILFFGGKYLLVTVYPACRRMENSSALQGRWPEGPEGFPVHSHISMANRRGVTTLWV